MENRKLRILSVGESSYLPTGFGTYYHEILKRLYNSNKYELCELAYSGDFRDQRQYAIEWDFISNSPANDEELREFNKNIKFAFGGFRFEETCLKFKPDIVFNATDPYYLDIYTKSPFRDFYHLVLVPTVDGDPQDSEWIDTFCNADAVFTYTDWGKNLLDKQGNHRIKTLDSAPPGADIDIFKPVQDKKEHKKRFNIHPDTFVVGTVMRNQFRKLFPDLMEAFAKMIYDNPSMNCLLYLHTTYPDVGWNIPQLIKDFSLGGRVLVTYQCSNCNHFFPSHFKDSMSTCLKCGALSARMVHPSSALSRQELSDIINLFDIYVQYATREGYGMGQVEAASCGIPIMSTDYSAMSDIVRKLKGYPIKVQRFFKELTMSSYGAYPDNDDFISKLKEFYNLPDMVKTKMGRDARKGVLEHYTYDKTAQKLMNHFDSIIPKDSWNSPRREIKINPNTPQNLSNKDFVEWCIYNIVVNTKLIGSYQMSKLLKDLNWDNNKREEIKNTCIAIAENFNNWEKRRVS